MTPTLSAVLPLFRQLAISAGWAEALKSFPECQLSRKLPEISLLALIRFVSAERNSLGKSAAPPGLKYRLQLSQLAQE